MNQNTIDFIKKLVKSECGDCLKTAKWMRDHLQLGGIKLCRKLIEEAMNDQGGQ